jgi:hypothetical protein
MAATALALSGGITTLAALGATCYIRHVDHLDKPCIPRNHEPAASSAAGFLIS